MRLRVPSQVGPFQITAFIGAGGMGEVYRARDTRLDRRWRSKSWASVSRAMRRVFGGFCKEAQAVGQLQHANVLSVYDVGVHDGAPYLVSELLEGESLQRRISRGPISPGRAIHYARQIAEGLAAAHAKGIVHRDVKPANLFVGDDDHITILDFGIAKLREASDTGAPPAADTAVGTVIGTVDYMSPEQVRGEAIDGRSDLFSLGIVLHEMLTGTSPFTRATRRRHGGRHPEGRSDAGLATAAPPRARTRRREVSREKP